MNYWEEVLINILPYLMVMSERYAVDKVVYALRSFVKKLTDEANNGALVVVEGIRDEEALRSLGFSGAVFLLCRGSGIKHLLTVSQTFKKTVILTDLDRKGGALAAKVAETLQSKNIRVDLFFRKELRSVMRGKVRSIQDLKKFEDYF
jgi:5S rRNA maturation endonuclease (ribonuclease M5)